MSSVAVNLRQAVDAIPDDQPFSLLGHHRCDEESMVGVITIHNTRLMAVGSATHMVMSCW